MSQPRFDDAALIIDKFGGIRPMSHKTNIPVTTIQGWKKRGVIPKARRDDILAFASQNDIDLTGSLNLKDVQTDAPATVKAKASKPQAVNENQSAPPASHKVSTPKAASAVSASAGDVEYLVEQAMEKRVKRMEKTITVKAALMSALFAAAAVAFMVFLFYPAQKTGAPLSVAGAKADQLRIAELEKKIAELEDKQSDTRGLIPKSLQNEIAQMQDQMLIAIEDVKANSGGFLRGNLEQLQGRVFDLEDKLGGLGTLGTLGALDGLAVPPAAKQQITNWRKQITGLIDSSAGQQTARTALQDLSAVLINNKGLNQAEPDRVASILEGARAQSAALGETMDDVPAQDLKAAGMLLAMTQFRSSLNRDNQPFNDDLVVLKSLAGAENIELQEALDRLAPHARSGVLTPAGLSGEFKSLSGEIVVASLSGEDVSIREQTLARMNSLFQVEKDGELVTGTPTQVALKSAENKLNSNDIEGAIAELGALTGPAAKAALPWIGKAQATLAAQRMKRILQ